MPRNLSDFTSAKDRMTAKDTRDGASSSGAKPSSYLDYIRTSANRREAHEERNAYLNHDTNDSSAVSAANHPIQ